jgi:hypothetical protein
MDLQQESDFNFGNDDDNNPSQANQSQEVGAWTQPLVAAPTNEAEAI